MYNQNERGCSRNRKRSQPRPKHKYSIKSASFLFITDSSFFGFLHQRLCRRFFAVLLICVNTCVVHRTTPPSTMTIMRALQVMKANGIHLTNVLKPEVGPGEVLVRVVATSINPSDVLNAAGGFPYTTYPRIPGRDYSGVVIDGSPEFIGQEVFGTSGRSIGFTQDGSHAEFVVIPEEAVVKKPKNVSFVQAATIGVPFTTAALALRRAHTRAEDTVLVIGATGSVGSAAVQLAKSFDCHVLTAARSATASVNISKDYSLSEVKDLCDGKGVDIIVDTTGDPNLLNAAIKVLAHGGRLSMISAPRTGSTELSVDIRSLYRNEQSLVGCNSLSYSPAEMAQQLRSLIPLFEDGRLEAPEEGKLTLIGLEDAVAAYDRIKRKLGGKLVIQP